LKVPYGAEAGVYTLEVMVKNDDTTSSSTVQVVVNNAFDSTVFKSGNSVWIVNPTDNVKVYRLVIGGDILSAEQSVVAVAAGSSMNAQISGTPQEEGKFTFEVHVFEEETLVETITLELNVEGNGSSNSAIVVLTIALAIIFLVLITPITLPIVMWKRNKTFSLTLIISSLLYGLIFLPSMFVNVLDRNDGFA